MRCLLEHVYQLLAVGDPALGEVDLQRNQDAAIGEKSEPGPEHFDLAEPSFPPCEDAQACGRLELAAGGAISLYAQLVVEQLELQIQFSEAL